jgi:23S rRNA (pseudouridine1915-N3)-methyltransferase
MKLILISLGKPHDTHFKDGIQEFSNRLNKYFSSEWIIVAPPKNAAVLSVSEAKKTEAGLLMQQIQKDDFVVLLDERGKQFSSPLLANFVQQRANESCKRIVFIIGGAFGVDELIIKRANYIWSLSNLVFPHMMVRLILAEQLYRACTILRNEKYHHE